jgi:tetraacyldisaccharide 4'-kinase
VSDLESGWRALVAGETSAWWAPPARAGLGVLSALYTGTVVGYRLPFDLGLRRPHRLPCRVVSIGNLTVGGTGKTTTVRWIVRRLLEWGLRPAVLSYGYRAAGGAGKSGTVVAGPEGLREPVEVSGDEPQLLARSLPGVPVLTGSKRIRSGERACAEFGVDVCVLDDAFQYWRLAKDLEIVLLDAKNPFGYGRLLPSGMLREPLSGLRRAHAAILTHADRASRQEREGITRRLRALNPRLILAEARHLPVRMRDHVTGEALPLEALTGRRWVALSSLGSPGSFETTLTELGAERVLPARFRDHHAYTAAEIREVCARARAGGVAGIMTTEKDSVKIPGEWLDGTPCRVLEIDLQFLSGQEEIEMLLRRASTTG